MNDKYMLIIWHFKHYHLVADYLCQWGYVFIVVCPSVC